MPQHTEDEIAQRRAIVAKLYLKGWTQTEIGINQGVSQGQISQDLEKIREDWRESAIVDFNDAKIKELAKLDQLESTLWKAWERSLEPIKKSTKRMQGKVDHKKLATSQTVDNFNTTEVVEERLGDPRYLEGVQRCIQKRCDLLGLDAPLKIAETDEEGKMIRSRTWVIQNNAGGFKVPAPDEIT